MIDYGEMPGALAADQSGTVLLGWMIAVIMVTALYFYRNHL